MKIFFIVLFLPFAVVALAAGGFFALELNSASEKIPRLASIMASLEKGPTRIVSSDGQLLYETISEFRKPVKLAEVPQDVINATLAAEDKRFYDHDGVDVWALARQTFTNVREQRIAGGASTLTMQLAKRIYTSNDQTLQRKVQDMALALQMERTLTKEQILELYLNEVFFGAGAYGIAAAAEVYFNKDLKDLTLAEAALLARCVRRPSEENPFRNPQKALENRNVVLGVMREEGMITREQFEEARNEPLKLSDRPRSRTRIHAAPYFVNQVLEDLGSKIDGDFREGGYKIETTLNLKLQEYAEARAARLVRQFRRSGVTTAAFVLANRQGHILALVGGADYDRNQFNMITQGKRQPGSAIKPLIYASAFEDGIMSPYSSIRNDTFRARVGPDWWEVEGRGGMTSVQSAIAFSMNPPAVRALEALSPARFVNSFAPRFGIRDRLLAVPSLVLGSVEVRPIELLEAFSVFQHSGDRVKPFSVTRVTRMSDGQVVFKMEDREAKVRDVFTATSAEQMDMCLRQAVTSGTGTSASAVKRARGKTGTTNDNRDAWFVGYTDNYIALAWVANEQRSGNRWVYRPMRDYVMGGRVPIRLWRDVLLEAQELLGEPAVRPEEGAREDQSWVRGEQGSRFGELEQERPEPSPPREATMGTDDPRPSTDAPPAEPEPTAPAQSEPEPAGGTRPSPQPEPPPAEPPPLPDGNSDLPEGPG